MLWFVDRPTSIFPGQRLPILAKLGACLLFISLTKVGDCNHLWEASSRADYHRPVWTSLSRKPVSILTESQIPGLPRTRNGPELVQAGRKKFQPDPGDAEVLGKRTGLFELRRAHQPILTMSCDFTAPFWFHCGPSPFDLLDCRSVLNTFGMSTVDTVIITITIENFDCPYQALTNIHQSNKAKSVKSIWLLYSLNILSNYVWLKRERWNIVQCCFPRSISRHGRLDLMKSPLLNWNRNASIRLHLKFID